MNYLPKSCAGLKGFNSRVIFADSVIMGRLERKMERFVLRGIAQLLIWLLLAPFKLLAWIFSPKKPAKYINERGYVVLREFNELEHRYIAMQLLGRKLYSNEVVHHINGSKTDNAVNNLCLMDSEKHEHFHAWLRWKKEKSGQYPTINDQKRTLETEYGGTLLENVESKPRIEAVESSDTKSSTEVTSEYQKRLFVELKTVREMLASENNVPLYMIFNNNTLIEMCEKLPTTESEMLKINGVGPIKIRQYGSYFLHEIIQFKKSIEEESA